MDLFHWKWWNKVQLGIYFVETTDKRYGCEITSNKEELLIDFFANTEKKYHLGFFFLKLLVKITGVNSFKVEQSYGLISLKMRKWSTIVYLFCLNYGYKVRLWIYLKQKRAVDSYHRRCWTKVPLGISFVETPEKKYGCEFI